MIAAMQGFIIAGEGWAGDDLATEAARRAVVFADALVEANMAPPETQGETIT